MSNRYQTPGKRRSRAWLWLLLLGAIIGAALLAGTATVMHGVSLDIENYCTIRTSPACQSRYLWFLSALQ